MGTVCCAADAVRTVSVLHGPAVAAELGGGCDRASLDEARGGGQDAETENMLLRDEKIPN